MAHIEAHADAPHADVKSLVSRIDNLVVAIGQLVASQQTK
jgi:hypothetical protein